MRMATSLVGLGVALAGCAGPCDELADAICERAGQAAEVCTSARQRAAHPDVATTRACVDGLAFAHELSRSR